MLNTQYQNKIKELSLREPWNHQFMIDGFKTIESLPDSLGNNINKWKEQRL